MKVSWLDLALGLLANPFDEMHHEEPSIDFSCDAAHETSDMVTFFLAVLLSDFSLKRTEV